MGRAAETGRRKIDLARIGFGIGNELRNRRDRQRGIDHHHVGKANNARNRRDVTHEIEAELFVECRIDRRWWADQ